MSPIKRLKDSVSIYEAIEKELKNELATTINEST